MSEATFRCLWPSCMELGYYKGPFVLLFKESIQVKGFIRVKVTSQGQQKARLALFAVGDLT